MTTKRIYSAHEPAFAEFQGSLGCRRPVARASAVEVLVIGHTGQVGSALVSRLGRVGGAPDLPGLAFREGINRSAHLVFDQRQVRRHARDPDALGQLGARVTAHGRPTVIVDCTADPKLPSLYPEWLRAGIGVVTPNKHGFSGDLALYRSIREAARIGRAPLGYSATVGAGLPILSVLRRLRHAGATPIGLSALVSGTLAHVFSRMAAGLPLSEAVADARELGYTEPDPLEDLSGLDVARKLLIMLREAGLEDGPVEREPVVDDAWADLVRGRAEVIEALRDRDGEWARRLETAGQEGEAWTYLAEFGPAGARVAPVRVDRNSPFTRLRGSGNLVRIHLADAPETPVEVQGPGAGVSITASAVMSDLYDAALRLSERH